MCNYEPFPFSNFQFQSLHSSGRKVNLVCRDIFSIKVCSYGKNSLNLVQLFPVLGKVQAFHYASPRGEARILGKSVGWYLLWKEIQYFSPVQCMTVLFAVVIHQ